jgi:hypothetical protein
MSSAKDKAINKAKKLIRLLKTNVLLQTGQVNTAI